MGMRQVVTRHPAQTVRIFFSYTSSVSRRHGFSQPSYHTRCYNATVTN